MARFAVAASAIASASAGFAGAGESDASDPVVDSAKMRFFEQEIRPLLIAKCQSCHGAEKQRGGLRLDSLEAALSGGETGPSIEPGVPDESMLIEAVRYEGLEMPPSGKLSDSEIDALVRWVSEGAVWPGGAKAESSDAAVAEDDSKADASFWSFQPLDDGEPPDLTALIGTPWQDWARTPIDAFVLARLLDAGLTPAPEASGAALIRRLTFDLTGLPPTPEEVDAFLADERPDAYERLVDRLLDSPNYGDRWGRRWLDVVRYAESDGHNADVYRPQAWRYRDYVVHSMNADKPYDRFVAEQLAGDELAPGDPEATVATGFLRLGPYEDNQRNVRGQWADILNEITDVAGEAFLGLSVGCARCHDHKFDPIAQADYYRLQAFFTPILPLDDLPLWTDAQKAQFEAEHADWIRKVEEVRAEIAKLEQPRRDRQVLAGVAMFTTDLQELLGAPEETLDPYNRQIKALANRQLIWERIRPFPAATLGKEDRERWDALKKELAELEAAGPAPPPAALGVRDVGPVAPPTVIPGGRKNLTEIEPGFPSVFDPSPASISPPAAAPESTGRRLALAEWLNRPDNPLATRVVVNRVWQHHFGRGLVATSNDFGSLGDPPSHPELLDWLARRFVAEGRTFKALHRLMVTSAVYRQSAQRPESEVQEALLIDPGNRLLWKRPVQRLEAEEFRDAVLAATGELSPLRGGPPGEAASSRRSVDCKVIRNRRDPVLDAFDAPDGFNSAGLRNTTTTVTQTLLLINGSWALERAKAFAARLAAEAPDGGDLQARDRARIERAYRLTVGRPPEDDELTDGLEFLGRSTATEALVDYAHVLLNANEFLYVD